MQTFIAATVLIVMTMLALGAGMLMRRQPLKGSCGGLACGGACQTCERRP